MYKRQHTHTHIHTHTQTHTRTHTPTHPHLHTHTHTHTLVYVSGYQDIRVDQETSLSVVVRGYAWNFKVSCGCMFRNHTHNYTFPAPGFHTGRRQYTLAAPVCYKTAFPGAYWSWVRYVTLYWLLLKNGGETTLTTVLTAIYRKIGGDEGMAEGVDTITSHTFTKERRPQAMSELLYHQPNRSSQQYHAPSSPQATEGQG